MRVALPMWVMACWLAGTMFLAVSNAIAGGADGETAALWQVVDPHPNRAVRDAQQQLRLAERDGNAYGQLRAWRILALAHNELLDMVALRHDVEHGEPLARRLGEVDAQCQFIAARGALERNAARYAESAALYDQAIALAEHHRLERTLAGLYLDKAVGPIEQGRESDALALIMKAHPIFEARQDRLGIAQSLDGMGAAANMAKARPEDIARAIEHHRQAIELLDPKQNAATLLTVHYNIGMAYYYANDRTQARQYLERGLASSREIEGAVGTAYYDYQLGRIKLDEKRHAEALVHLDRALPVFRQRGDLPLMVLAVTQTRADALSLLGRVGEALDTLEAARALLPQFANAPGRESRFHEIAAGIHARHGQYEKAYQELAAFSAAEKRRLDAENTGLAAELKTRFEVSQKESENAVLRAQQHEASARRMVLFLALSLSLVVLGALAVYLGHQVRRSRRFAALALRDDLTGMPNRRSITEYARLQWAARSAHEGKLRIAILDIDHFKHINDDFGHDVGDAVLAAFAQACAGRLRSSDRLGRYGGEEFLLIMPGSDAVQVSLVFTRLQHAVHAMAVPGLPPGRRITFSMGAAEAWGDHDTLADLIHRADEALYRAKQNGRDRCESAPHVRLAASSTAPVPLRAVESEPGGARSRL